MRRSAAALNDRWSYASGSTYQRISLRSTALTGVPMPPRTPGRSRSDRSAETGQRRSASRARPGDRPRRRRRRPGPRPTGDLLAQRAEELLDVDGAVSKKSLQNRHFWRRQRASEDSTPAVGLASWNGE